MSRVPDTKSALELNKEEASKAQKLAQVYLSPSAIVDGNDALTVFLIVGKSGFMNIKASPLEFVINYRV